MHLRAAGIAAATALLLTTAPLTAEAAPAGLHVAGHRHLKGTEHHLTYDVEIPVFSGAHTAAVNRRILASARDTIAGTETENGSDPTHHTLDGTGRVTTNDGRTVQVILEYGDYYDGAAHPTDTVETVALVAATGAPITLRTVFPHERAAFTTLAKAVRTLAAKADEPITEPSGLKPVESNWTAWQSTTTGFQVSFQDYQLGGHGLRSYTVPWHTVLPLLSAKAKALLAPRS